jgi:hypothetical protein
MIPGTSQEDRTFAIAHMRCERGVRRHGRPGATEPLFTPAAP